MIDRASERFDNKRESLQTDTELKINAVEERLNMKIQSVLDNPLASFDFNELEPTAAGGSEE
jgi:hypothetical protein